MNKKTSYREGGGERSMKNREKNIQNAKKNKKKRWKEKKEKKRKKAYPWGW